jgi:DNA processing protein
MLGFEDLKPQRENPAAMFAKPPATATVSAIPGGRDGAEAIKAVLSALGPAPVDVDAVTRATGLDVQSVQIALLELDLAGRIERQGQGLVALKGER